MNVTFFMHNFAGGGVEKMRLKLAAALSDEHCNVSIVVVNASGPLAASLPENIKLFDLRCSRLLWSIPKLRRHLAVQKPDVVVSSLDHNNIAALCACSMLRSKIKLIICQHNALSMELQLGWKYRVVPRLYKLLAGRADAIVAVSRGVADDLASTTGISRNNISVVSNPVVDQASTGVNLPPPHPWFEDPSVRTFVFVGRLVAQKDPNTLLVAFAYYLARKSEGRLIVVGEGPMRGEMAEMAVRLGIAEHICFAGFVANPMAWISHAHALLLTSRYEGFANVIVEALACGTPVIATDCPHGPREILEAGRYGRLISVGDSVGLADAMQEDLRTYFPAKLLRRRALDFTIQAAGEKYLALFNQCIARYNLAFGLKFSRDTANEISQRIINDKPIVTRLIITPNVDHVRLMLSNWHFREACRTADIVCADGWPVACYAAARGATRLRRLTGCEIVHNLIVNERISTTRVFSVVESADTAVTLARWLASRFLSEQWTIEVAPPNLAHNPGAQKELAKKIQLAEPHILIMTLGAPTSEVFVNQNMLPSCWVICVGQGLRVELGLTRRAPQAWRYLGLEWAWRCYCEPKRLGLRYLRSAMWFPYAIAMDFLRGGKSLPGSCR